MLTSRDYQTGEAARMFGIPGTLLEYERLGLGLTYQNLGDVFDKFVRSCLSPNYLEPIEQAMTDLLPRSTMARFNLGALLRADAKTRWRSTRSPSPPGVHDAAEARVSEGLAPGYIETAPVPFAPPAALPPLVAVRTEAEPVECAATAWPDAPRRHPGWCPAASCSPRRARSRAAARAARRSTRPPPDPCLALSCRAAPRHTTPSPAPPRLAL